MAAPAVENVPAAQSPQTEGLAAATSGLSKKTVNPKRSAQVSLLKGTDPTPYVPAGQMPLQAASPRSDVYVPKAQRRQEDALFAPAHSVQDVEPALDHVPTGQEKQERGGEA